MLLVLHPSVELTSERLPLSFFAFVNSDSFISFCNFPDMEMKFRVAVVGGGPSGSCAAEILAACDDVDVTLFERKMDNAKPCGGAIPLCMIDEFDLPVSIIDRKVRKCFLAGSALLLYAVLRKYLLVMLCIDSSRVFYRGSLHDHRVRPARLHRRQRTDIFIYSS